MFAMWSIWGIAVFAAIMVPVRAIRDQVVPEMTFDNPPQWNPDFPAIPPCATPECNLDVDPSTFDGERDVKFLLYTRENPTEPERLSPRDISLLVSSYFYTGRPTKILTHGWMANVFTGFLEEFKNNYLFSGDYNVVGVDWSALSVGEYVHATSFVPLVGMEVAKLLELMVVIGTDPDSFHLVGHSLGAHIMGIAGTNASFTVPRITGLDPAGWLFELPVLRPPWLRLARSSARHVEVIHTCAGLPGLGVGFTSPLGHADFYANGGQPPQPGCPGAPSLICSHARSQRYFVESIITVKGFWAVPCDSYDDFVNGLCDANDRVLMGAWSPTWAQGVFYLDTQSSAPFAIGRTLHRAGNDGSRQKPLVEPFYPVKDPDRLVDFIHVPVYVDPMWRSNASTLVRTHPGQGKQIRTDSPGRQEAGKPSVRVVLPASDPPTRQNTVGKGEGESSEVHSVVISVRKSELGLNSVKSAMDKIARGEVYSPGAAEKQVDEIIKVPVYVAVRKSRNVKKH